MFGQVVRVGIGFVHTKSNWPPTGRCYTHQGVCSRHAFLSYVFLRSLSKTRPRGTVQYSSVLFSPHSRHQRIRSEQWLEKDGLTFIFGAVAKRISPRRFSRFETSHLYSGTFDVRLTFRDWRRNLSVGDILSGVFEFRLGTQPSSSLLGHFSSFPLICHALSAPLRF